MKINVQIMVIIYNSKEVHELPRGGAVRDFLDRYLPHCPPQAHRMLVDKQGIFRGVVLVNKVRAGVETVLRDGDDLTLLSMISGG